MAARIEKLAVLGVGLIGGSFGLLCRKKRLARRVWGYSRRESTLKKAQSLGLIDQYSLRLKEVVEDADVVMLALPVEGILEMGEKIRPYLRDNAVVTDTGSTKAMIVQRMEKALPPGTRFVGGHPIAGTENSGPEAAFAELFTEHNCLLTPTQGTDPQAVDLVRALWEETGALVSCMDPQEHDRLLANISHLPHMTAFALVNALSKRENEFPALFSYTAGGLKDFTRIASSSPVMWRDICLHNGRAIVEAIEDLRRELAEISRYIRAGNGERLEAIFQNSKDVRERI